MNEYSLKVDAYVKQDKLNTDYEALTNKPSINGTELNGNVEIKTVEEDAKAIEQNKTDISALAENITQVLNKVNSEVEDRTNADTTLQGNIDKKQDILVSGTNIKTINNNSILGEGNITIEGGSSELLVPAICRIDISFIEPTSESETVIYYDSSYKMYFRCQLLNIDKTQITVQYSISDLSELPDNSDGSKDGYLYALSYAKQPYYSNIYFFGYNSAWIPLAVYVASNTSIEHTVKNVKVSATPTAVTEYASWDDAKQYGYIAKLSDDKQYESWELGSYQLGSSLFDKFSPNGIEITSNGTMIAYVKDATPISGTIASLTLKS